MALPNRLSVAPGQFAERVQSGADPCRVETSLLGKACFLSSGSSQGWLLDPFTAMCPSPPASLQPVLVLYLPGVHCVTTAQSWLLEHVPPPSPAAPGCVAWSRQPVTGSD